MIIVFLSYFLLFDLHKYLTTTSFVFPTVFIPKMFVSWKINKKLNCIFKHKNDSTADHLQCQDSELGRRLEGDFSRDMSIHGRGR